MRCYILIFLLLLSGFCYGAEQQQPKKEVQLPSLGSCDEYTDYYIYKCMPYKCKLQIGPYQDVYREMETIGYENDVCIHDIKFTMRNKAFPPANFNLFCRLSERGRLEMANLFTRYKKGEIKVYVDTIMSKELKQECSKIKQ